MGRRVQLREVESEERRILKGGKSHLLRDILRPDSGAGSGRAQRVYSNNATCVERYMILVCCGSMGWGYQISDGWK